MDTYEAIMTRRSIRKFTNEPVSDDVMVKLLEAARLSAVGANMQPLKFIAVKNQALVNEIFKYTKWSGYAKEGAPSEDERPNIFIAILLDKNLRQVTTADSGIAASSMMILANSLNLGSCMLGAINREEIGKLLDIDIEALYPEYLIGFGYPAMESKAVEIKDGDVKYYFGEDGVLNVPKRTFSEVCKII